jgi:hypothetical protein
MTSNNPSSSNDNSGFKNIFDKSSNNSDKVKKKAKKKDKKKDGNILNEIE